MCEVIQGQEGSKEGGPEDGISYLKRWRLNFSATYYSMAHRLGLKRLQELLQGGAVLQDAKVPVHLLGRTYTRNSDAADQAEDDLRVAEQLQQDIASRLLMTYRKDFPPIGDVGLTCDAGWGCTLRSGQMLIAQALLRHALRRKWRRRDEAPPPEALQRLLRWFWDLPGPQHPFSIHALCSAGQAHGLVPGEWLGPSVLCRTLQTAVNTGGQHCGLHVHVLASPGGGAPVLYTCKLDMLMPQSEAASGSEVPSSSLSAPSKSPASSLVLLIPLTLGPHGKINPRYTPQLLEMLKWPQSLGIVGGRPSSSLYFIGCQAEQVLYLDPHDVQEAVHEEGKPCGTDFSSYWCSQVRTLAVQSIDPSLAIGFYCRHRGKLDDLCQRLRKLEAGAAGAPLLSILDSAPAWETPNGSPAKPTAESAGHPSGEEWEML